MRNNLLRSVAVSYCAVLTGNQTLLSFLGVIQNQPESPHLQAKFQLLAVDAGLDPFFLLLIQLYTEIFVPFSSFILSFFFSPCSPSRSYSSHALRSLGVRLRSLELLLRAFLALSCAWRYFSSMLLCFLLSLSLHHILSQYSSTCGRLDGPISCMISLNHVRDCPIWLDEPDLLYVLQGIQALYPPADRSLNESERPALSRAISSSTVSPWRTSRVMRARV